MIGNACLPVFTVNTHSDCFGHWYHRVCRQTSTCYAEEKKTLAAGMTRCERCKCRTKSKLAGLTWYSGNGHSEHEPADYRSQERICQWGGQALSFNPPPQIQVLLLLCFLHFYFLGCSCLPVYSLYLSVYLVPLQTVSCYFPFSSPPPPVLCSRYKVDSQKSNIWLFKRIHLCI